VLTLLLFIRACPAFMSSLRAKSDKRLPRSTKVYKLVGSQWADQGTAFCYGQFDNENNQAFLIARSEANLEKLILSARIRTTDVYQRQQGDSDSVKITGRPILTRPPDTLIVWTEPDGSDYALSFQDADGCGEVWNFIIDIQRHLTLIGTYNPSPTSISVSFRCTS
jgi:protein phosphatase-4 regulatory subunit 3